MVVLLDGLCHQCDELLLCPAFSVAAFGDRSSLKSSFSIVTPKDSETPGDPCKDIVGIKIRKEGWVWFRRPRRRCSRPSSCVLCKLMCFNRGLLASTYVM